MKKLTLTFDNGPDPECTPMVLDLLKARGIKATFFVCGRGNTLHPALQAETDVGRALMQRIRDEGHWLGNHTLTHTLELGTSIDEARIAQEISANQDILGDLNDQRLFRPYMAGGLLGNRTFSRPAIEHLQANKFTIVLFNNCPRDWEFPDTWPEIVFTSLQEREWTMIILHDVARYRGMAQLERFLDAAIEMGVAFEQDFPPDCVPMRDGNIVLPIDDYICGEFPADPRPFSVAAIATINAPPSSAGQTSAKVTPPQKRQPQKVEVMSDISGKWNCTVKSPLGDRKSVMTVTVEGDTWTGTNEGSDGTMLTCENGKVQGNSITWAMKITSPMPMTVECDATIDGDTLTGTTKAGAFGSFAMTGTRAA
jgi:peptidoglycan-N-acetylglucosamine deacetylase